MTDDITPAKGDSKIKKHFAKYKTAYLVTGAVVVTAVVTLAIMKRSCADGVQVHSSATNQAVFQWKPEATNTTILEMVERSVPSNIVQSDDGLAAWASQNEAAKALGVSASYLSKHLRGLVPSINGKTYHTVPKVPTEAMPAAA